MQAKDIPVRAVLESVVKHGQRGSIFTLWADDFQEVPFKVLKAKLDKLDKQGILDCCCNECSYGIRLKPKGKAILADASEQPARYSDLGAEK